MPNIDIFLEYLLYIISIYFFEYILCIIYIKTFQHMLLGNPIILGSSTHDIVPPSCQALIGPLMGYLRCHWLFW